MRERVIILLVFLFLVQGVGFCKMDDPAECIQGPYRIVKKITYKGLTVDVVIDKPVNDTVDVLMTYHGSVAINSRILEAAHKTLNEFKRILDRTDMMIVSVAYPEEHLLMGDNVAHSEAALLWVRERASQELGVFVRKIFLAGHSQGGYIVTRLNTMHAVDGVIANAPGPLNLEYRCDLEINRRVPASQVCTQMSATYGGPSVNPTAYMQRSLLNFTAGHKSAILFVQGLSDSPIQLHSWPTFKQAVNACSTCRERIFLDLPGYGHTSLFESPDAKLAFNQFIQAR